ncbi:MAG: PAS domain S-box protein, partial [Candidatus Eisenbacteria bacterium]|nr:PAS domain S-box protein [Candidatus Eisenbacteria bacterium]
METGETAGVVEGASPGTEPPGTAGIADAIARVDCPAADVRPGVFTTELAGRVQRALGIPSIPKDAFAPAVEWVVTHAQKARFEFELPFGGRVDALLVPERDEAGKVRALLVSTHGVTNQTQSSEKTEHLKVALEAQEAVRSQRDLMDKILTASSVGLAQAVDRKILWANDAMENLFGLEKAAYEGQDTRILYPSDEEYSRVGRLVYEQVAANQPIQFDAEFARRNGERFFGHVKMNFLDAADRSKGMITSIIDITDRKRAEAALRASEEKYRAYVEHAPEAIFVLDDVGRCTNVNDAACRLTGYSRDELRSMSIRDLDPPGAPPEAMVSFSEVKHTGRSQCDIVIRRKDGGLVHASLDAVALTDGQYLAFCADLTERRRAAAEKAKLEEQLRQSQKMEAVGRLAGGVAHDFNNILTGINGCAEMILRSLDRKDPRWPDVSEIHNAGQRAAALVDQLLAFSRK